MKRVAVVGLWHETNTYSSRPTTLDSFHDFELDTGRAVFERHTDTRTVIGGFIDGADIELVPVFSAGAWPAGPVTADAAEKLLDMLTHELAAAGPLDGILANLHGAMVAEGRPDMEAEAVAAIRSVAGGAPMVGVVDFHANPSVVFVDGIDVVIGYDTYPHVDMHERGVEAVGWMERLLAGERPKTHIGKHPLLTTPLSQSTDADPMASLFRSANASARRLGVERVCIAGGFAYSDTDRAGVSVLATTGADNSGAADALIGEVLSNIDEVAADFTLARPGPAEAVAAALGSADRPVVLADVADNIGGGSSGDGTALLAQLLEQNAKGALVVIADAAVAAAAHEAGVGATLTSEVGAKTDELHGSPVSITGTVEGLSDGRYRSEGSWGAGQEYCMGPTARLAVDGVDLVVTTVPTPPFHVEQVTHLGIDPARASVITAKGAVAWRSAFGDIVKTVIEVDAPGVCPIDVTRLPRTTTPVRHP